MTPLAKQISEAIRIRIGENVDFAYNDNEPKNGFTVKNGRRILLTVQFGKNYMTVDHYYYNSYRSTQYEYSNPEIFDIDQISLTICRHIIQQLIEDVDDKRNSWSMAKTLTEHFVTITMFLITWGSVAAAIVLIFYLFGWGPFKH